MSGCELIDDAPPRAAAAGGDRRPGEPGEEEMIMHLERDQLVAETFRPVARATFRGRATAALWTLRIFTILVGLMVIYTFVERLQ
ncbi:MAG TPA: hypothetical protein VES97_03200 [Solirubrobacteraceae bacterium]|nr:hypothetical protein [Solirubrobacteraceae bacterium]